MDDADPPRVRASIRFRDNAEPAHRLAWSMRYAQRTGRRCQTRATMWPHRGLDTAVQRSPTALP